MAEIINAISYRDIAKIQTTKIKELEEKIKELKALFIISLVIFLSCGAIGFFEVKNFVDNPQEYLPPNWVEVVEVPELEKLEGLGQ